MRKLITSLKDKNAVLIVVIATLILILMGLIGYRFFIRQDNRLANHKRLGSEYLMKEDYIRAKEEYSKVIKIDSDDLVSFFHLAEACIGLKEYKLAAEYLTQALMVAETSEENLDIDQYSSLWIRLADCYRLAGMEEKRLEVLKEGYDKTQTERLYNLLQEYYPDPVQSQLPEGEYYVDDDLEIILTGSDMIYFTLDHTDPTTESILYQEPLNLSIGTYEIKAAIFNEYGFQSETSTFRYTVKTVDYLARANERLYNKEYNSALEGYQRVIKGKEDELPAYYGMAKAYIGKEEYDKAIQAARLGLTYGEDESLRSLLFELLPAVASSIDAGEYISDKEISVALSSSGKKIYYTTDGTKPSIDSSIYEKPIPLRKGENVIMAVSESIYGTLGKIGSFTYTIYIEKDAQDQLSEEVAGASNHSSNKNDPKEGNPSWNKASSQNKAADAKVNSVDAADNRGKNNKDNAEKENKQAEADESGNILWVDPIVEAVVRKALNKAEGTITVKETKAYKGGLDLSGSDISSLSDLIWFTNLSFLSLRGEDVTDSQLINNLKANLVIAVYHNMDEVKAIQNTSVLKKIDHFGIRVADFSLNNMTILQMLDFYENMNRIMMELTNLEYLDLSDNGLTDISIIGEISNISNVKSLILKNNEIQDISVLKNFKNLIYLDITNNIITDYSPIKHVATVIGKKER